MGIMMLAAAKNSEITLVAEGSDESHAIEQLSGLIEQRFGEDE
jgi:phosphocarrier protein